MARKDLDRALRELCLAFPSAEAKQSHGMLTFRVQGGKVFVMHAVNHHGDGRVALWLPMPEGAQREYVADEPKHFFVPPYVGPRGWLGVRLDLGLPWGRVRELVRMAYETIAPPALVATLGRTPTAAAPRKRISAAAADPANSPRGKRILAVMRSICLALPDTNEGEQFGAPVWRVGQRVFARASGHDQQWRAAFWVGAERQSQLIDDLRYSLPAYLHHNGWIALDVTRSHRLTELHALALASFRHFAPKRTLQKVNPSTDSKER